MNHNNTTKILVVDDEPRVQLLISQMFRRQIQSQQFEFSFAAHGQEALEQLKINQSIEVVLTDLNMPQMDGLTLLAELEALKPELNPVLTAIVISAYGDMDNIRQAMNNGAFDFLVKPLDLKDLEMTLNKAIAHIQQLKKGFEQQKLAQDTLLQAKDAAEAANRVKSEFLAAVSHELRTPLNAVLGMAELLQEEVYGPVNHKQVQALHTIEMSGRHLLVLINNILDLSKIEMGKLELNIGPVAIEAICQNCLQLIQQQAQKKRLQLVYQFNSEINTLYADGRRLKQILTNLLNNAIKFTQVNGRIGLEVNHDAEQQKVSFSVWDTGIGIAQEDIKRLFKPFVQLDARLSREYEGTGLGLALVA
ncbi:MAG: response regulator, partial [Pseudomonadota bacterium]|nr:response regulator [Pseudomonadota bacterium]